MTIEEVNSYAVDNELDIMILSSPSFDNSIIGITTDDRVVYDMDLMIADLMQSEDMTETEAIDYIEYNTIRALSYVQNGPIVINLKHYDT